MEWEDRPPEVNRDVKDQPFALRGSAHEATERTTSVTASEGTTNLAYDYEDRLTSISGPGGVSMPATGEGGHIGIGGGATACFGFGIDSPGGVTPGPGSESYHVLGASGAVDLPASKDRLTSTTSTRHSGQEVFGHQWVTVRVGIVGHLAP